MDSLETIKFRDGDYFKEIEESYNEAVMHIRKMRTKDFEELSKIKAYLSNISLILPDDKKAVIGEINRKIDEIVERY